MLKNKKLALTLLTGVSYILSVSGTTLAQTPQVPSAPLSPNDPAAKLDPALLNVPAVTPPKNAKPQALTNSNVPIRTITYNVKTGKTQVNASRPATTSTTSSRLSPPSMGLSANINTRPLPSAQLPTSGAKPNTVIGPDNRVRVSDTTAYPWRTITKLYMTYPSGQMAVCSGTLISATHVLTAGHCVHNADQGGWAAKIQVIPGLNGTYAPYGSAWATGYRSYTNWTSSQNSNYDIALIALDRPIGNTTSWLSYTSFSTVNGISATIAGYPGDRDGGVGLYYHYDPILTSSAFRLFYQIDTYGGQSGSGIVYNNGSNNLYIFGVHTTGTTPTTLYNSGTSIDLQKYNDIKSWISSM